MRTFQDQRIVSIAAITGSTIAGMNMVRFIKSSLGSVLVVFLPGSVRGRRNQHRKMYVNVLKSGARSCGNVEGQVARVSSGQVYWTI